MEALQSKKGFICDMDGVIYQAGGTPYIRLFFLGFIRSKLPFFPSFSKTQAAER